ncbi:phage tail tape measure protein, partial [Kribbella deserti]
KRYATTESQIRIAWNGIKDAAIEAGSAMLPVIRDTAEHVADLAKWFGDLPEPVKNTAVALTAIVAAGGLVVGMAAKMVVSIAELRAAQTALAASSTRAGAALTFMSRAGLVGGGIAALAIGFDILGSKVKDMANATHAVDMSKLTGDMLRLGETGKSTGELLKNFGDNFSGVGDDGRSLAGVLTQVATTSDGALTKLGGAFARFGVEAGPARGLAEAKARVEEMDNALADLVAGGNAESAAKAFDFLAQTAATQGVTLDQLKAKFPEYSSALNSAAVDAQAAGAAATDAGGAAKTLAGGLDAASDSAEKAQEHLDGYIKTLLGMPGLMLSVRDAQRGVQAAIDDATDAIADNGRTLDINTPKGRANQAALDAIAASANQLSEQYLRTGASQAKMTSAVSGARKSFIDLAVKMGLPRVEAAKLAAQLIAIPSKVDSKVTNNADQARAKAKSYNEMLLGIRPKVNTPFTNNAAGKPRQDAQTYNQLLLGVRPKVHTPITNTAPEARAKAEAYARALGLLPESESTSISAPGAESAASSVRGLVNQIAGLPSSKTVTITYWQRVLGIKPDTS